MNPSNVWTPAPPEARARFGFPAWALAVFMTGMAPLAPAWAQAELVLETNPVLISGATAQVTMAADIAILTAYLTGTVGVPPGNGLIALNSAIDARLSGLNNAVGQLPANADALDRLRKQDEMDMEAGRRRMPSYARSGCYDITMALSRSGGSAGTANKKRQIESSVLNERETYVEDVDRRTLINRALEHSEFCSPRDIQAKRPGCVGGSVSQTPNADIRSSTLNRAPSKTLDGVDLTSNYTLTDQGQKAARAYISNVVPQTLPQPDPTRSYSETNNVYLVNVGRYNARASVVTDVLTTIAAAHSENAAVVGYSETSQIWRSQKTRDTYRSLFPDQEFPEVPSEMELLRYEVFQQYGDPTTIAARQSLTEKELALESLRIQSLNARLNLLLIERIEGLTKLEAAALSQSLDPMTRGQMAGQLTAPRRSE